MLHIYVTKLMLSSNLSESMNGSKQNDSNPVAFATRHANGMIHACQVYMHMLVPIVPTKIIINIDNKVN